MFVSIPLLTIALGVGVYRLWYKSDSGVKYAIVKDLTLEIDSVSETYDDAEQIGFALADVMMNVENLSVTYDCSDEVKMKIDETIDKICVLSTNECEGYSYQPVSGSDGEVEGGGKVNVENGVKDSWGLFGSWR